ncbi:protein TIFY 5A-like [Humulus lupulus]|uniref:protein TIFY 5A-like n=1 Tax=Humulus lupulus TaxID=3486 RepID=UPI002B402ED6|nr:protein TIFY 5A-like [Humulus lupulus]
MRKNNLDHFGLNAPLSKIIKFMNVMKATPSGNQQVTVFFNGRAFVCDMTELQARAILLFANKKMEEGRETQELELELALSSVCLQSQICGSPGLSMKRSLQRFLQKRKQRSQASSPYNYNL